MDKQILKVRYKQAIKDSPELAAKICTANQWGGKPITFRSLERWLLMDSEKLTTATTLQIIRGHLGLSEAEVLTEAKAQAEPVLQS